MKNLKKRNALLSMLIILSMIFNATACGADKPSEPASRSAVDPSGAEITVPEKIDSIVVLAPAIAEMVIALGDGDKIIAYDSYSADLNELPPGKPIFDLMNPDMEQLVSLKPDLLLVSNLSLYDAENPYQQLIDLGVCVACIPTSDNIEDIQRDITFVADILGRSEEGEELIRQMQEEIDSISAIAETVADRRTVYFEISSAPYLYSFGSGVFLNEMIELIGAENILGGQEGWLSVGEESVVAANPDVILTNVNYVDNPTREIMERSGWDTITAVQNGDVYYIDNTASSLPDQNIIEALKQMAEAVYPEYYGK